MAPEKASDFSQRVVCYCFVNTLISWCSQVGSKSAEADAAIGFT